MSDSNTQLTSLEKSEETATTVGLVASESFRVVEIVGIGLLALVFCPPLLILVVVVGVPLLAIAAVLALVAAILAVPVVVVRHLHLRRPSVRRRNHA
jgi:hypothetical protein